MGKKVQSESIKQNDIQDSDKKSILVTKEKKNKSTVAKTKSKETIQVNETNDSEQFKSKTKNDKKISKKDMNDMSDETLNNESDNGSDNGSDNKSEKTSSDVSKQKQKSKPKSNSRSKAKSGKEDDKQIDYSYLRLPENKVIYELKEHDNKKKSESKNNILSQIDKAHNILYGAENIEGEDALNDIMNWIFIKSIQPILSNTNTNGKIDLLNKEYYSKLYDDDELDDIFSYLIDLKKLANADMKALRDLNESNDIIRQMGEILKTHPITRMIFTENNFIKARKATTIQTLLRNVIIPLDITELESNEDVIGEIYEHIINGYVKKGSKLGQFFTPRTLMKLLLHYKESDISKIIGTFNPDKKIIIGDTCMGTGGWIVTAYNMLKSKFGSRLLLSGGEVKPSTFQYGLMNLILTIRQFPHDVRCESSLTHINSNKAHFLFTNPPFQTDKKFDQIKSNFESDIYTKQNKIKLSNVYTLQDNNPPIQFLELDYYKLEEGGMCMIVLPYGELFFGSSYTKAREHFLTNCNITEIILFPGGIFTHTGIKTCALIFQKDSTGTKQINYLEANKTCNTLTRITTVKIEDINKEPNKSLYVRDYLKDEYIESLVSSLTNFEWVEFGEVFSLEKGELQSSKVEEDENGDGVMITQSKNQNDYKKITNWIIDGENIFIGNIDSGKKFCLLYYDGKCNHTNLLSRCIIDNKFIKKINLKFVYYYLKSLQTHFTKIYLKGSCNLSLDAKNFNRMKIPIPSLKDQEHILKNTMFLESDTDICKTLRTNNELKRRMYMEAMIVGASRRKINKISTIGEECEIEYGTRITKAENEHLNSEQTLYPVYGGGGISFYTDKYNRDGTSCKISRFGMSEHNCVLVIRDKYYLNDSGFTIKSNNTSVLTNKYLSNYLLLINSSIYNTGMDLAQRNINLDKFRNLDLPIPPIEYQQQMEKTIDNFDWFDEYYTNRINENDEQIKTSLYDSLYDLGVKSEFCISKYIMGNIDLNDENQTDVQANKIIVEKEDTIDTETPIKKTKKSKSKST